jgi:DNA-binding GntR family transcriptional regulator
MPRKRSLTRAQSLADTLQSLIENGDLRCGERLRELHIAEQHKYSQNTVRDALAILEQQGWVIKKARHGVYVRSFGLEEALEVCDLVFALQEIAYRSAACSLTPQTLERMRNCVKEARASVERGNSLDADTAFFQFYKILVHSLAQPLTAQLLDQVIVRARILVRMARDRMIQNPDMLMQQVTAHETILDMLQQGKIGEVLDLIKYVTTAFREVVQNIFTEEHQLNHTSSAMPA